MEEEKKLKEWSEFIALEKRVAQLEKQSDTINKVVKTGKETALFIYDNAPLVGILIIFVALNMYVWRKLS